MKKRAIRLCDALDKYVDTVSTEKKGWQQESYRRNVIKKHPISQRFMHEIAPVDIAEYRDHRLSEVNPKTEKSISGNTVRLEMALMSALFNLAIAEWGTCSVNPVKNVRKPKCNPGRDRRLLPFEERKIAKYTRERNYELYVIIMLALETSMRQGEILSLQWELINLQAGIAHLPETKNGTWRDVPLSSKARQLLTSMDPKSTGRVFSYTSSGLKSAWRNCLIALNIVGLHFHDLRHEAISRLFELGSLNVIEVATISGHKSLNMLKRYTHLRAYQLVKKLDAKRKVVNKIASYFVPYPAVTSVNEAGVHSVELIDFGDAVVSHHSLDKAVEKAGVMLLKILAQAAQAGRKIPVPGELRRTTRDMIVINPLS